MDVVHFPSLHLKQEGVCINPVKCTLWLISREVDNDHAICYYFVVVATINLLLEIFFIIITLGTFICACYVLDNGCFSLVVVKQAFAVLSSSTTVLTFFRQHVLWQHSQYVKCMGGNVFGSAEFLCSQ